MDSNHGVTFYGRGGDDAFALNSRGVDTFDGGNGLDTAFYNCDFADAIFDFDGTHWTITVNVGGTDYTDTLIGVEGPELHRPGIPAGRPCRRQMSAASRPSRRRSITAAAARPS